MMLRITAAFLFSGLIAVQAEDPVNQTIIGADPSLSAGADALRNGRFEEGVSLTLDGLDAVKTARNRASALSNLCAGYLGIREFAKALQACDRALEFNAQNWRIYNNRALALLRTGHIVAARADLEKGLALNPDSPTLAKVAGLIHAQAGSRMLAKAGTEETQ